MAVHVIHGQLKSAKMALDLLYKFVRYLDLFLTAQCKERVQLLTAESNGLCALPYWLRQSVLWRYNPQEAK